LEDILLTHAQLAAALAGFASVVAAFQRPLSPVQHHRFLTILLSSLLQIIGSLVPVWVHTMGNIGPLFWSLVSGVQLGLSVFLWAILVYPLRSLGKTSIIALNTPVTIFVYALAIATMGVLVTNTFISSLAGFALYYSSLLGGFTIIFLVFADVATRSD